MLRYLTVSCTSVVLVQYAAVLLATALAGSAFDALGAAPASSDAPLIVGHRTIHVFRAPLGDLTAAERAEAAQHHIERVLEAPGDGWTSIKPVAEGVLVELDGKSMFTVIAGDARKLTGETTDDLANRASRILQKVWSESRECRDGHANLLAIAKTALAFVVLGMVLAVLVKLSRLIGRLVARVLRGQLKQLSEAGLGSRLSVIFVGLTARSLVVLTWVIALAAIFTCVTYALGQFAVTRPVAEDLAGSFQIMLFSGMRSAAAALPGLFVAVIIFMLARIATQVSHTVFDHVASGRGGIGTLDAHTAPATRRLVNVAIWLFALAMAYPYLPGSQTEAFKGLSVILGIMVSIGASGLIGQIASGMILVFTRALMVGEYVRIQDCEGTVTELGLFVTRLRTGTAEEIALPNSLIINQVLRNFSRSSNGSGFIIETTVTIGYDAPWRQVHAMLQEAAKNIPAVRSEPAPAVIQTALSDFYVEYRLVAHVAAESSLIRSKVLSELNAAIQDIFNRNGVQIMSPHYIADPEKAKIVPESQWETAAALPRKA